MKKFLRTKFGRFTAGLIFLFSASLLLSILFSMGIDLQIMGNRFVGQGTMALFASVFLYTTGFCLYFFGTLYFIWLAMAAWGLWEPFVIVSVLTIKGIHKVMSTPPRRGQWM